ncbi:hypothetical protein FVEG_03967 [Fusarium verticillioides 7600]|uniref:Uncharacterized protein n=1 Tax=Gibberella moniliformis (strain M3125 / FGSC 7600) TaxID=334819 RepID=W7LS65_GIBM7|nr:hypothetical protein FVEG_03967 [Fusarium verticillioides 7600]EWG42008.1 hypothetical protein FVEG_03967 [Fusarium verticillioides 7600]
MRLTNTILAALQASMGLAFVVPNDAIKKAMTQHKHDDADLNENKFHGYERITKITSHRYFGPKDHKHHHEEKKHDGGDDDDETDDDDDDKEEHVHHPQKVKEKHNKSKKHDDDDGDDDDHKKHHSHNSKKKQHDEEDEDKDEDKEPKLIFHTDEYKKAKKEAEDKFPWLKDDASKTPKSNHRHKLIKDARKKYNSAEHVELETPKRYNKDKDEDNQLKEAKQKLPSFIKNVVLETPKRYNELKNKENQVKEGKKKETNSKDGKMYKMIHRGGMVVKRDIDINIHAPTFEIYHDSDKKHEHGDAELIKIFHVSSQESTHGTKDPEYKHDDEQKHKESTKEHHSLPKSHHKHTGSKNYDSHDKDHFGGAKKYPQSSKGHNQTQRHHPTPVVEVTKKILQLLAPLMKKETGRPDSSKQPSQQYKSYPSHASSDKGRPSPHGNRYPNYKEPYSPKDTHHDDKSKNGHKKSDQAEDRRIGEKLKNNALRVIIESLAELLAKKAIAHKHSPKKTHPSQDDHDRHYESKKKHHSHQRPSYRYKEHAEYKHDDSKKHVKLSQNSSSHYEPGYKHEELDSHHNGRKKDYDHDHDHEDSKKGRYSHNKPISQYKKKIDYKHDGEEKHIKVSKDHVSQHEPTHHDEKPDHHHYHHGKDHERPKRPRPHHDHQEADYHGHSEKSKGYYPYNKPKHQNKEHSKYKHDDDNGRGPFDQRVKLDRKPSDHYTKSRHHKDHEDETKAYKDHLSHLETHTKRSSNMAPKLNTTQILNLEALSPQDRKRIAMGLPLDRQTRKEFGEFKDCSPKLIAKLNVMYARILDDPKYAPFIKYLNTEREFRNRKRCSFKLTPAIIARIEAMDPATRALAADELDFDPKLKKEFVNARKLYPSLIKKLEKWVMRNGMKPKYKKILEKLMSREKRAISKSVLTPEMLAKIEAMDPMLRAVAADRLDFDPKLKKEFVNAGKLYPGLVKKLEKEYERIAGNPKYKKILEKLKSRRKRAAPTPPIPKIPNEILKRIEAMDPILRRIFAERFDLPAKLTDEFVDCGKLDQQMIHKLNWEYARIHKNPKFKKILQDFNINFKRSEGHENTEDELKPLTEDEKKGEAKLKKQELKEMEASQPKRLTAIELEYIGRLPKVLRAKLAKKMDMPKDLRKWFTKKQSYTGENLERLNEVWLRIQQDPEYADVVKKVQSLYYTRDGPIDTKYWKNLRKQVEEAAKAKDRARAETPREDKIRTRSVHQLTEKELERLLKLDKYERQALARKVGLEQSLAREFINASKPSTEFLEKLNEAVSKSVGTPQYRELLKLVGKEPPKPKEEKLKLESIKKDVRLEIAKSLEFDDFTRDEFLEAKALEGRLLDKVAKFWGVKRMKNAEQGKDDIKHTEIISKLLESALDKTGQQGGGLQSKSTDGKKLTEAEQKMKDKIEKTKANGWCDEFVNELGDTLGPEEKKEKKEGN